MASNIVRFSDTGFVFAAEKATNIVDFVVEADDYETFGIVCVDDVTEGRLQRLQEIVTQKYTKGIVTARVVITRTGEVKIVKTSRNVKATTLLRKHNGIMVADTNCAMWVALDEGNGRPLVMAAECCSRVYPHDIQ